MTEETLYSLKGYFFRPCNFFCTMLHGHAGTSSMEYKSVGHNIGSNNHVHARLATSLHRLCNQGKPAEPGRPRLASEAYQSQLQLHATILITSRPTRMS
ncbi:hypothetical protein V6N13_021287 [Hibiscus sabdariffa]